MEYLMNAQQMKAIDTYSIQTAGIPSIVLMERAALAVTDTILRQVKSGDRVLCVCGYGNNGADGLAVARQLAEHLIPVEVYLVGSHGKTGTQEFELQKEILENIGVVFRSNVLFFEYNFIVDAVFGIGLSRKVEGCYAETIAAMNQAREHNSHMRIVSVDIPSGIHASSGQVMALAVRADETVTFGYQKIGMVLYPGASYAGNVIVAQIGFAPQAVKQVIKQIQPGAVTFDDRDLSRIPARPADSNKGSYGKVLIIAGSENMGGAACLSALGAFRSGCGLVRVLTHVNNRNVVMSVVPEAIVEIYQDEHEMLQKLEPLLNWATCIAAGPGIGISKLSYDIVKYVLQYKRNHSEKPLILDADALNQIAENEELMSMLEKQYDQHDRIESSNQKSQADQIYCVDYAENAHQNNQADQIYHVDQIENTHQVSHMQAPNTIPTVILTPHMGEMSRLTQVPVSELKKDPAHFAQDLSRKLHAIVVLKDAVTTVTDEGRVYYNTAGNSGMATAGSGDVLTGVITGMSITPMNLWEAACMGVYVHSRAGDYAAEKYGSYAMKAMDITNCMSDVLKI